MNRLAKATAPATHGGTARGSSPGHGWRAMGQPPCARRPFVGTLVGVVLGASIAVTMGAAESGSTVPERIANHRALTANVERAANEDAAPSHPFDDHAPHDDAGMVPIPAGTYRPFYKAEVPTPPVAVTAFTLDERPVSKREFLEFVRENPQWRKSGIRRLFAELAYLDDWEGDLDPGPSLDEPVTFVSWFAARAYCDWLRKRLPTVAEWERVAGNRPANAREGLPAPCGSSPFQFAMGSSKSETRGVRWPVFGAIWEWTQDFNSSMVSGELSGESAASLFCGAGVRAVDATDYGGFLRYSFRSSLKANYTLKNLGFRCAKTPRATNR